MVLPGVLHVGSLARNAASRQDWLPERLTVSETVVPEKGKDKPKTVVFFIDQQKFRTEEATLTVRALLEDYAKEDPSQTVLVLKKGNELKRLENLEEVVEMENGLHFIVFHEGPTQVS